MKKPECDPVENTYYVGSKGKNNDRRSEMSAFSVPVFTFPASQPLHWTKTIKLFF